MFAFYLLMGAAFTALLHVGIEQATAASKPASSNKSMQREEAARILGVSPDADATVIRNAYRELMRHNHPDRGGSEFLASQINQAKDVLLKK